MQYPGGYNEFGVQPGMQRANGPNPSGGFDDVFYGAGSGFIRNGLGVYGNRILGTSRDYVQSNVSSSFETLRPSDEDARSCSVLCLFGFVSNAPNFVILERKARTHTMS